jgi:ABC-2 type transport system permease protein
MRRFIILTDALLRITLRERATLFWGFAFPVGLILLYGAIYGQGEQGGIRAITWLALGIVVLNIMAAGLVAESGQLADARERGLLLRLHATPLPPLHLVGASILVRLIITLLQSAVVLAAAVFGFGAQLEAGHLALGFAVALVGALVFFALGQAIGAAAPGARAAFAIGQACYFPTIFVSNLFVPTALLPAWLVGVARFTPAYMLVDVLRPAFVPAVVPSQPLALDLIGLAVYAILGILLTARFFGWAPRA